MAIDYLWCWFLYILNVLSGSITVKICYNLTFVVQWNWHWRHFTAWLLYLNDRWQFVSDHMVIMEVLGQKHLDILIKQHLVSATIGFNKLSLAINHVKILYNKYNLVFYSFLVEPTRQTDRCWADCSHCFLFDVHVSHSWEKTQHRHHQ